MSVADSSASTQNLLVCIPCLNEEKTIAEVIKSIPTTIEGISTVTVLVVDDGSTDATAEISRKAGAVVIRHPRNMGVGTAFKTAVDYAVEQKFCLMANIDGDKQFNPQDIPKLVAPVLLQQADMVTASRFIDASFTPSMPRVKLIGNHMMSLLISTLCRQKFHDVSCGFRCYNRNALLHLNLHGTFTYTQETFLDFASKHLSIMEVPVHVTYFADRKSRVANNLVKYAFNTAKIIFRGYRDYYPLRFFWGLALLLAIPALLLGSAFILHFLTTGQFTGYLFAGFSAGFFAVISMIFFILGMLADMLNRIRTNQERILYFLKKNTD